MIKKIYSVFDFCWLGDSASAYQLGFQNPATTTMEGIFLFNLHLLFLIIGIVLLVAWLMFSILYSLDEISNSKLTLKILGHQLGLVLSLILFICIIKYAASCSVPVVKNTVDQHYILATAGLPSSIGKFSILNWILSIIHLVYFLFLEAELTLIVLAVIGFYTYVLNEENSSLVNEFSIIFNKLPYSNRFFLGLFTLTFAIPNKWWVNNNIKGFLLFILISFILVLGFVFPFIFLLYFVYLFLIIESFFFGLFYEKSEYFRSSLNYLLFGNSSHPFASIYFQFFWGNMFTQAGRKLGPAAAAATTVFVQREREIRQRDTFGDRQVRLAYECSEKSPNPFFNSAEEVRQYKKACEKDWTLNNGTVTKLELILNNYTS